MNSSEAERLKRAFVRWAGREPSVTSLAVVGSWARGTARDDSDLDILAITERLDRWAADDGWLRALLLAEDLGASAIEAEVHGVARGWRAWAGRSVEIEVTLVAPAWALTTPIDPGTRRVVEGGLALLVDGDGLLRSVQAAVLGRSPS